MPQDSIKILVVDHETDFELLIRQYFREKIIHNHYQFVFTHSLEEALSRLEKDPEIQIVICDLKIISGEGLDLLKKISTLDRFCKAIVISAFEDMATVRLSMNLGAFDFIMKPINFKDLENSIDRLMEVSRLANEAGKLKSEFTDLEKQLDVARSIQQSFIPHNLDPLPEVKTFELFGTMIPAKHVGGDFFDFFPLSDYQLGIVMADVSGKGVPAALFMAVSRTVIRSIATQTASPLETMKKANHLLNYENETSLFVTAFYGIFDARAGEVTFCNAGHNPPLLLTKEGSFREFQMDQGLPLGILNGDELNKRVPFHEHTLKMNRGETLVLYTDGITEAMRIDHSLFGLKRFEDVLKKNAQKPLSELIEKVMNNIQSFTHNAPLSDDCTLLCLRFLG